MSKRPLYRKGGRWFWKGIRVDDDLFNELMHDNPKEVKEYNQHVKKMRKRRRRKNDET